MFLHADSRAQRAGRLALYGCCASIAAVAAYPAGVDAATPVVVVTPGGPLHNGQAINVSVGPNSLFTPHSRVNILECADPGGSVAKLPTDDSTCDGNTIQGDTILVGTDGSFSEAGYTVFQLPSAELGEQAEGQPVCNTTNPCVLYVGQDQNDFSAPKLFSAPFSVGPGSATTPSASTAPAAGSAGSSPSTSASVATGGAQAGASSAGIANAASPSAVSDSGALAQTGSPDQLLWTVVLGSTLLVAGSLGRRLLSRSAG